MEKENKNDLSVFNIDHLIKETYNKIAAWHNEDSSSAGLKQLSIEIIEEVSKASFKHIGLDVNLKVDKEQSKT